MFEENDVNLTAISELGEFGLIKKLTESFEVSDKNVLKGVGDDAAVYSVGENKVHVITTDILAEGVHFDLAYVPLKHLGYKAVVVNLSDVYAMNAIPFGITVSIAMSNRYSVEAMEELYLGIKLACEKYNVSLLGGDTSTSKSGMVITVTALGKGEEDKITYRSGAKVNELICVSGDLGSAYAGLQMLEQEKSIFIDNPSIQPDLDGFDYVIGRQLKPEARPDVIDFFIKTNIQPSSMIDLSDGLASDLLHICDQSNVGAVIYEGKIPIDLQTQDVADKFKVAPVNYALDGGEDYELLFTVSLDHLKVIGEEHGIHIIGHIKEKEEGVNITSKGGSLVEIKARGWDHFKKK